MADVADWFRRRTGDEDAPVNGSEASGSGGEPADGFTEAGIREALRDVKDPEIGRDLISLNMISAEPPGPSRP